ncbi:MAG: protease HtpX [Acidobacteria bacterium]|nr:protease HtpX [Acidobacteriota bacterium]
MGKRIFLFLLTNIAVVVTLSIILSVLGVGRYVGPAGLNLQSLAIFCFVWGMGGAFISLQMSRFIARQATGARLIDGRTGNAELDWLHATVARLTQQASLPMPEVAVYDSPEVNAFATGPSRSRSLVAVSSGLLGAMRHEEVEGVLGHEIAHISNGDMVTMTLLQGVINAFVMFFARIIAFALASRGSRDDNRGASYGSWMVVMMLEIVLGILGSLVTAWFSRQREFRADRGGAALAGRDRMLSALRRLAANRELVDTQHHALATLKINGARSWMVFFATHPPIEARIAALEHFA